MKNYSEIYPAINQYVKSLSTLTLAILFLLFPLDGSILLKFRIKGLNIFHILFLFLLISTFFNVLLNIENVLKKIRSNKTLSILILLIIIYPFFRLSNKSIYFFYLTIFFNFFLIQLKSITLKEINFYFKLFLIIPTFLIISFYLGFWDLKESGNFGILNFNVNTLAINLSIFVLISYYFFFNEKNKVYKLIFYFSLIIFTMPIIQLTGSRTSYLFTILLSLILIYLFNNKRKYLIFILNIILLCGLFFFTHKFLHDYYINLYSNTFNKNFYNLTGFVEYKYTKFESLKNNNNEVIVKNNNNEVIVEEFNFDLDVKNNLPKNTEIYGSKRLEDRWKDLLRNKENEIYGSRYLRLQLIKNAYEAYKEKYIFGHGLGVLEDKKFMSKYMGIDPLNIYGINGRPIGTHNGIMSYLIIGGIVYLFLMGGFFLYIFIIAIQNNKKNNLNLLPLIILIFSILAFNILLGTIYSKFSWISVSLLTAYILNKSKIRV